MAEADATLALDRRISFRIGVHIGEVMIQAGDLFGDGVNIAARLQSIAKPGGVCISGATYDQVRKVLPITFVDLGVQQVKNIQEPIRAYQVGTPSEPRERGDNFLNHPIGKILLLGIAAHVLERQHGDGRLVRKSRGRA